MEHALAASIYFCCIKMIYNKVSKEHFLTLKKNFIADTIFILLYMDIEFAVNYRKV